MGVGLLPGRGYRDRLYAIRWLLICSDSSPLRLVRIGARIARAPGLGAAGVLEDHVRLVPVLPRRVALVAQLQVRAYLDRVLGDQDGCTECVVVALSVVLGGLCIGLEL